MENIIKNTEQKVKQTISEYNLINPEDNVIVALSGGKDSTTCLHILKKLGYNLEAFTVDVQTNCYTDKTIEDIKKFCEKEKVKLHLLSFEQKYGETVFSLHSKFKKQGKNLNSCTICGVLRRQIFQQAAKQAGATKIATGHNMDDEVQSILMNTFRNKQGLNLRIAPKQTMHDQKFIPKIKPLFFLTEDEIIQYSKAMEFNVPIDNRIPCSDATMRYAIRQFINQCTSINPSAVKNIMNFFLSVQKQMKVQPQQLNKCSSCGAPATETLCRPCQLLRQANSFAQFV